MSGQIKIYASQLRPESIINLDQPCHFEEFHELPGYLHNDIDTFNKINERYLHYIDASTGHWTRLLEHIDKWGIIYPVIINTGLPKFRNISCVPMSVRATSSRFWMLCEDQGGLRILAAKQMNLPVPTIINDHTGLFEGQKQINMRDLAAATDGIQRIYLSAKIGIRIGEYPKLHLSMSDDEYYYHKTEAIQQTIDEYRSWSSTAKLEERINTLQRIEYADTTNN